MRLKVVKSKILDKGPLPKKAKYPPSVPLKLIFHKFNFYSKKYGD